MNDILSQIIAYAPDKIDTELKARALVQGSRNMADGGSIGKPGGLVEEGVTKYGVTETASGSYKAEVERRGKRLSETFKTKSEAEAVLEKFKQDNPTYAEENTLSSKQKKQYVQDPKKIKALNAYAQAEYGVNYRDLFGKENRAKQTCLLYTSPSPRD